MPPGGVLEANVADGAEGAAVRSRGPLGGGESLQANLIDSMHSPRSDALLWRSILRRTQHLWSAHTTIC